MAWSPAFREDVVDYFGKYCERSFNEFDRRGRTRSLDEFISGWLFEDTEVVAMVTGGSFTTWLEVVLIIIDEYGKNPSILDFKGNTWSDDLPCERRVKHILMLKDWGESCLDPHVFHYTLAGGE